MDQLAEYRARQQQRFFNEKQQNRQSHDAQETSRSSRIERSQSCTSMHATQIPPESSRPASSGSSGYACFSQTSPGSSRPGSSGSCGSMNSPMKRSRGSAAMRAVSAARASRLSSTEAVLPGSSWPGHLGDQGPLRSKAGIAASPRPSTPSTQTRHRSFSCSFQERTRIPQPWVSTQRENLLQEGVMCH
eukprot:gnl/MRDRNA2_/MRDRNA2_203529_c0_seq1.p1 gnl/MRDRNA2_/MRDRNA2_203529_c0~~gnl/MRDRNA2_/MRDRNA2_203529_c0_seq1.p1  ORF type:complete len:189 (+),score=25.30 gnl/MRDRNA2_/MRDRNA2_203529_c0_seq1:83-649(+)